MGWSVDNSRMGTGGVTEWAGWAFATDEFWSRSQRDQWRELNVRSRDVFAVADSDEWDDKSHTGAFDSTPAGLSHARRVLRGPLSAVLAPLSGGPATAPGSGLWTAKASTARPR